MILEIDNIKASCKSANKQHNIIIKKRQHIIYIISHIRIGPNLDKEDIKEAFHIFAISLILSLNIPKLTKTM